MQEEFKLEDWKVDHKFNRKASFLEKIRWKLQDIYQAIVSIPSFVRRVIDFIPILWHDRDWDHSYLYTLLQFKIKRMRIYHEKYSHIANSDKIIKQMRLAELLIQRIKEDDYHKVLRENFDKKYGEEIVILKKDVEGISDAHEVHFTRNKCTTLELIEQEKEDSMKLLHLQMESKARDIKYLFAHLAKRIERWWD